MFSRHAFKLLLLASLMAGLLISCKSTSESLIDTGTAHAYRIGFPEVKARATGFFDENGNPVIDLNSEIPFSSLIFTTFDGKRRAVLQMDGYLRDTLDDLNVVHRFSSELEANPDQTPELKAIFIERRIPVAPGKYELELLVKDLTSNKTSIIKVLVDVPDPENTSASISDIRVTRMENDREVVISSFLVPAQSDSLTFSFFVTRPEDNEPTRVEMRLMQIRADMDFPRAMSNLPITTGSLPYRGIDYNHLTDIQVRERILESETGSVLITFSDAIPESGIYRFEILLHKKVGIDENSEENTLRRFRDFSIVSPNFPQLLTQRETINPLHYLMDRREFERITAIENSDSLRRAFEQFWLKSTRNRTTAREVIELYYSRIEEANQSFTTFKEGWKTDMGMIYVLLGPPLHVESTIESMIWYYGYDRMDPRTIFRFERTRVPGSAFPFHHYVLVRNRFYHEIEHGIVQDWRTGRILNRRGL